MRVLQFCFVRVFFHGYIYDISKDKRFSESENSELFALR
jgi:hypothetical protein